MAAHPGKLIMFEGPDGAGKTTQIELARQKLQNSGHEIFVTRAHGGTPIGEALRVISLGEVPRSARTDLFISLAIHSELQAKLHRLRQQGTIVLLDRGSLSMWPYQVFGDGMPREEAAPFIDRDMADFDTDLVICYQASLLTLRKRMSASKSKADYFEAKDDDYFGRVIKGYEFAAERYNAATINSENSLEQVHDATMQQLDAIL